MNDKREMLLSAIAAALEGVGLTADDVDSVETNCGSARLTAGGKTYAVSIMETEPEDENQED